jgi:hypothetical protein
MYERDKNHHREATLRSATRHREATLGSCGDLPVVSTDDEITAQLEDLLVMTGEVF